MQNHLTPTNKEWKVIERALEDLKDKIDSIQLCDLEIKEDYEIIEKYLNFIKKRDVLNDKY